MKATYEDHMGSDLSVVNAAKVSFGKRSEWDRRLDHYSENNDTEQWESEGWTLWDNSTSGDVYRRLSKKDQGLIQFLARGCTSGDWNQIEVDVIELGIDQLCIDEDRPWADRKRETLRDLLNHIRRMPSHWSPFAHTAITLHLKMPIFVARQIMKHTTGLEYNEVSRRYVDSEPEFYVPDVWRKKADNVKQGSSDEAITGYFYHEYQEDDSRIPYKFQYGVDRRLEDVYEYYLESATELYDNMLEKGVAPEQARMVLPQSMYTEVIATGNLYAWANLYIQRTDSHAQKETQDLAKQIGEIIQPLYPVSWAALVA